MVYKRLYIQVIFRVVLLLLTCLVLARIIFNAAYVHASIVVSALLLIETLALVRYLNQTNRKLSHFFSALPDRASSMRVYRGEPEGAFRDLSRQLEKITFMFQDERREKEAQHNYLNYLIEQIGVGIISYGEGGKVDLINPAAKDILSVKSLPDLAGLNQFNPDFEKLINEMELKGKSLIRIIVNSELYYLSVQKSLFKIEDSFYGLISFQDINSELDKKELDSWQKIIRVLTHEIMSSISPVTSLSGHLLDKVKKTSVSKSDPEGEVGLLEDLSEGLEIIYSRGEGLMEFVRHYHSLTHLPVPLPEMVRLKPFLEGILKLIEPECNKHGVLLEMEVEEGMQLSMDPKLIEQVLLNLIRNSIQALEGIKSDKRILVAANPTEAGARITVSDKGCGIDMDNLDNIFIPFYTTREKGSGIGLSMAKQIMRLHDGQISVRSEPGDGAEFSLKFTN